MVMIEVNVTKMSFVLVFGLLSATANACEKNYYGIANTVAIPETYLQFRECEPDKRAIENSATGALNYDALTKPATRDYSDYWSDWVLKTESNPFLSQHYSSSYFGIGVWDPNKSDEDQEDLSTQDWLMDHGLQFSLGIGEKKAGEPRLRFDYLWHDEKQDNLMMQVEVPF